MIIAFMIVVLIAVVGLGLDGANGYYNNLEVERAAAAAALSGVPFEPTQPANAITRATNEANRNGYAAGGGVTITITHGTAFGQPKELRVKICAPVSTFFMIIFGIKQFQVCRTATAGYVSPISIGQPGQQLGSTVSQLGTAGNFYFVRTEGWSTDRQQGDGFTPNPNYEYGSLGTCTAPMICDQHVISGPTDIATLPDGTVMPARGGWNYEATLTTPGSVWVYNAIDGPDWGATSEGRNHCENMPPPRTCAPGSPGSNYYYHEEDGQSQVVDGAGGDVRRYTAMRYTLFQINNVFNRTLDTPLLTLVVKPIDATHWDASPPTYHNVNTGATITQNYGWATGPSNMFTYHAWIDVLAYGKPGTTTTPGDGGTVPATGPTWFVSSVTDLPPGDYRLRVDSLNYDGSNPTGDGHSTQESDAHKGYAVAASGPGQCNGASCGNAPSNCLPGCNMSAMEDVGFYTPLEVDAGGQFDIPIINLDQQYRGQWIVLDFYDQGDVSSSGTVYADIISPQDTSQPYHSTVNQVKVFDMGRSRLVNGVLPPDPTTVCNMVVSGGPDGNEHVTNAPCVYPASKRDLGPDYASWISNDAGINWNNGHWIHAEIYIDPTYCSGGCGSYYWFLRYRASAATTAQDTMTFRVGLKGAPAHILDS